MRVIKLAAYYTGIISLILCSRIFANSSFSNIPTTVPAQFETINALIQAKLDARIDQHIKQERALINYTAYAAVNNVKDVLILLEKGDVVTAKTQLSRALFNLQQIAENKSSLDIVPIEVNSLINDDLVDYDAIRVKKREIDRQWQLGRTQVVRYLLNRYSSDFVVRTRSVPVTQFIHGIKQIKLLIKQTKVEDAKRVIESLLKVIIQTNRIIPLPLCRAELIINEAEQITRKTTNNQRSRNLQITQLLSNAEYQLKLAQQLGYGNQNRYQIFYQAIEGVRNLLKADQKTTKLLIKLRSVISVLKNEVIDELS